MLTGSAWDKLADPASEQEARERARARRARLEGKPPPARAAAPAPRPLAPRVALPPPPARLASSRPSEPSVSAAATHAEPPAPERGTPPPFAAAAQSFDVSAADIVFAVAISGASRGLDVTSRRDEAVYWVCGLTALSAAEIAQAFGMKRHEALAAMARHAARAGLPAIDMDSEVLADEGRA